MTELLSCEDLRRSFRRSRSDEGHEVKAVDGVSFSLSRGETLGVVGESGCGKSTLGRLLLRLIEPTSGRIVFDGRDISQLGHRDMRVVRRKMQAIFQNPYASLNPYHSIRQILEEPFSAHKLEPSEGMRGYLQTILELVGLEPGVLPRRSRELSGGQLQRIAIARALALDPEVIVADEPTSALDVSIQAQILNLLTEIQREKHISYVFISHNLNVVEHVSDRVAVMYLGRFVEVAASADLYSSPLHPYTQLLLSSVPAADPVAERERPPVEVTGEPPDPAHAPPGCPFHPRCAFAQALCSEERPDLRGAGSGRAVACHFAPERTIELGRSIAAGLTVRRAPPGVTDGIEQAT